MTIVPDNFLVTGTLSANIPEKDRACAMSKILIIDDDEAVRRLMAEVVQRLGHCHFEASLASEGLKLAAEQKPDIVMLDVHLPDGDGLEIVSALKHGPGSPEIIIITAFGNPDGAELAIKNGAWDYLVKPSPVERIMLTIRRALEYRKAKSAAGTPAVLRRDEIIGHSRALNTVLERIALAANSEANVLITGETGTGKELVARAIHANSARCRHRFVVVDCAALPESLVESTLFGHVRGAFTGAEKPREGLIRQADGGTLFLDEVGELPVAAQKAFLRVIQERRFRPVSGKEEIKVNFRLIAATNRNLEEAVTKGQFRSDLLFRLRSLSITTPALRERKEDIRPLATYYINRLCEIYASEIKGISSEFMEVLETYDWPGNVRELFHCLEESLAMAASEPTLHPHHLPVHIRAAVVRTTVSAQLPDHPKPDPWCLENLEGMDRDNFMSIHTFREMMERRYLEKLTLLTGGNRKEACRISGLSRTRLFELLKKYDLSNIMRKPGNRSQSSAVQRIAG